MAEKISALMTDWVSDLRAARLAQGSLRSYQHAVRRFIASEGDDLASVNRRAIRHWLGTMTELSPATQQLRWTVVNLFCTWLVREQVLDANPMAGLPRPAVVPVPVEPYAADEIAALLTTCEGWSFGSVRDMAIIRLLVATGMRRTELATITLEKLDLTERVVSVLGKGRGGGKWRVVPFDEDTGAALRRYLRKRRSHKFASSARLWLGERGPMTTHGVGDMITRRAQQAGLEGAHAHKFRHTFAINWLGDGGGELALQQLAGWSGQRMVARYTAARAQQNALAEYRRRRG